MKYAAILFIGAIVLAPQIRAADTALTIYNQNFAVVRETVPLDLKSGVNQVRYSGASSSLEPSSVILRDPAGTRQFQILEQNFRADPVTQELLLSLNEGKSIQFEVANTDAGRTRRELVSGKIVRSGYQPGTYNPGFGGYGGGSISQPIIEVDGKLRFSLPGLPLFPTLADDTVLKPTLLWVIQSAQPARFDAELSYVTEGMNWSADYNLVLPEQGETLDMAGWVTMNNESGKAYREARIKLMAGDVNKIRNQQALLALHGRGGFGGGGGEPPTVTEKSFDEYHLYTLENRTTLLDKETKQVEFVRAAGVRSVPLYIYDGANLGPDQWFPLEVNTDNRFGTVSNKKISMYREITNSTANQLGIALPKGKVRFYRRNSDGQMEFTGENVIDHTPKDEVLRIETGNAFDIVGERKRTGFKVIVSNAIPDPTTGMLTSVSEEDLKGNPPYIDETFEITLRNHKKTAVEVRVVEHLYRWSTWTIKKQSDTSRKKDAQTIEFPIQLKPDEERKVTYTVHYSW